jgi:UDP-N-acetylglucosamine/UDP-N-acetylgalactosamine diphosphorylase
LFQLQAERILKLQQLAKNNTNGKDGSIVWYIMTSASTVKPTTDFFKKHNYFGLEPTNVVVFQQGTLPCFTFDGKIIMDTKYAIAKAPDGNGGLYRALKVDGILGDMNRRGIEYIQLYCVDNALVRVGDPVFTGYCISKNAECGNKVVAKGFPSEAVGITCKVDGEYHVVEYSEITSKSSERRNSDGNLTYSAANICIHFFTIDFLKRVVEENESQLVHHVAKKKIPYTDLQTGKQVKPDKPNGIKMEKFVFDVFQFTSSDDRFAVWECIREDEFAPLKNAPGASDFTPMHCRNALYALHQKYVMAAGGVLVGDDGKFLDQMMSPAEARRGSIIEYNNNEKYDKNNNEAKSQDVVCEISPLVSYAGEGLEHMVRGKHILAPASQIGEIS